MEAGQQTLPTHAQKTQDYIIEVNKSRLRKTQKKNVCFTKDYNFSKNYSQNETEITSNKKNNSYKDLMQFLSVVLIKLKIVK